MGNVVMPEESAPRGRCSNGGLLEHDAVLKNIRIAAQADTLAG